MSKRKLTAEDKKCLLLEYFHETLEIFQLKELEKVVPRVTGIPQQNIKDILQILLDEELVESTKIGSSLYYWSYPGKAKQEKLRKLEDLQKQAKQLDDKTDWYQLPTPEIELDLSQVTEWEQKNDELKKECDKMRTDLGDNYDENDTKELWEKKRADAKIIHEAANRWTDNVFNIKSWCKKKLNCEDSVLDKQFGIPADFDYLE